MKNFLESMSDLERAVFAEIYVKHIWADARPSQALAAARKTIASMRAMIERAEEMPETSEERTDKETP